MPNRFNAEYLKSALPWEIIALAALDNQLTELTKRRRKLARKLIDRHKRKKAREGNSK